MTKIADRGLIGFKSYYRLFKPTYCTIQFIYTSTSLFNTVQVILKTMRYQANLNKLYKKVYTAPYRLTDAGHTNREKGINELQKGLTAILTVIAIGGEE